MSDDAELIARLEKASGPDRESDELIFTSVTGRRRHISTFEQYDPFERLPDYTASIDAAMTLVPEGWNWRIDSTNSAALAKIESGYQLEYGVADYSADGATPAIALCIVALKARASVPSEK